ncbi:hypothetical protein [Hyphomicrobium facile]|nr:hypothetical protein [Hyphomicrobium facile]
MSDKLKEESGLNVRSLFLCTDYVGRCRGTSFNQRRYPPEERLEDNAMALEQNRDFIDVADEAIARREARRVILVGVLALFVLGVVLFSVLMYGRILTDDAGIVSAIPATSVALDGPARSRH